MDGLEFVRTYLDDLLVISSHDLDDHLDKLSIVFDRLLNAGLRVQINKCTFCSPEVAYLGYTIGRDSVNPQTNKLKPYKN